MVNHFSEINVLELVRLKDWIKNIGIYIFGFFLGIYVLKSNLTYYAIIEYMYRSFLSLLSLFFIYSFAFLVNDYFDWKIGKEKRYLHKIVKSRIIENYIRKIIVFLFVLSAVFVVASGVICDFLVGLLLGVFLIFGFMYSVPPSRLKRYFFFSIPINAFCIGVITFLSGYVLVTHTIDRVSLIVSFAFFIYISSLEIIHQIAHLEEDSRANILSLPVYIGISKSVYFVAILQFIYVIVWILAYPTIGAVILVPMFFGFFRLFLMISIVKSRLSTMTNVGDFFGWLRNRMLGSIEYGLLLVLLFLFAYF